MCEMAYENKFTYQVTKFLQTNRKYNDSMKEFQ